MAQKYTLDIFGIIVLIMSILLVIFLIIAIIYYYKLMTGQTMSKTEATAFFYLTIIFALIFAGIAVYALIHIFHHNKVPENTIEENLLSTQEITTKTKTPTVSRPVTTPTNVPQTGRPSDFSVTESSLPVTQKESTALKQELAALADAESD